MSLSTDLNKDGYSDGCNSKSNPISLNNDKQTYLVTKFSQIS